MDPEANTPKDPEADTHHVVEMAVCMLLEFILVFLCVFNIFWQMHNCFTKVTTFQYGCWPSNH